MKTSNKILLGALALIALSIIITLFVFRRAVDHNPLAYDESGGTKTEELQNLEPFDKIKVEGNVSVYYTQGNPRKIEVKADSSLMQYLVAKVEDGELYLRSRHKFKGSRRIDVFITTDSVIAVSANAGGTFKTEQKIKVNKFNSEGNAGGIFTVNGDFTHLNMELNAGAIANFEGTCENMNINSNVGAIVNAEGLTAQNATVNSSTGSISNIFVTGELSVFASTGSIIKCQGNPSVKQSDVSTGAIFNK